MAPRANSNRSAAGPNRRRASKAGAGGDLADRLARSIESDDRTHRTGVLPPPSADEVAAATERLRWLLFPGFLGPRGLAQHSAGRFVGSVLRDVRRRLEPQLVSAFAAGDRGAVARVRPRARSIMDDFLDQLPRIREILGFDVQAAYDGDPAARNLEEIVLCYPGLLALSVHRLAHELFLREVPLIPRVMSEWAHRQSGIDIHPGARIGRGCFLDHGTGIVIGETTEIGDFCKIYQGVTLGAKSFERDASGRIRKGYKRHPTLEDHVTVYAGATILGGDTVIGRRSVVNGGVFLTRGVPPDHVVQAPRVELTLRTHEAAAPRSSRTEPRGSKPR